MKKILILSSFPAPYRIDVFKGIADHYAVDIIFATNKDQDRSKDYFVGKESIRYMLNDRPEDADAISECIKNLSSYHFVLGYDWYLPYAILIIEKCIRKGIPYLINCDGAFMPSNRGIKNKIKNLVKRRYVPRARRCLSSGEHASAYFRFYGADPEKICVHNFSSLYKKDILTDIVDVEEKSQIKKELKLDNKITFVAIGQFIRRKGFDVLLEAWQELDDKAQLIIIGGGGERESYERWIEQSGYQNVKILDYMDKAALFRYYLASDCFVLPTREDIWGLVVNEAMAVGLPVITTDRCIAGLELIENGVNGYVVPVENAGQLAEKMTEIAGNNAMRSAMAKNNIAKIQDYTIEEIVQSHIDVFKKIL